MIEIGRFLVRFGALLDIFLDQSEQIAVQRCRLRLTADSDDILRAFQYTLHKLIQRLVGQTNDDNRATLILPIFAIRLPEIFHFLFILCRHFLHQTGIIQQKVACNQKKRIIETQASLKCYFQMNLHLAIIVCFLAK